LRYKQIILDLGKLHWLQVISRSGRKSRQSQLSSSVSKARESAFSTGSPISDSDYRGQSSADLNDFGGTDIYNDDGWDTDLEEEHIRGTVQAEMTHLFNQFYVCLILTEFVHTNNNDDNNHNQICTGPYAIF